MTISSAATSRSVKQTERASDDDRQQQSSLEMSNDVRTSPKR